ncbi:germ cell-specific gene 1-like protein isoform X2 [Perca fluviatilis]|uniref:germ cell-specific gene 1-like protein isoform X2 n=1 Tax=Perca fluviatilis TaxID=8168 RepID=UPI001962C23F|nr:germ cell-specific gene 1-like protein isoform X2 [Perca fluviatilis]
MSSGLASIMRLEHGRRASLAITLNFVAFAFALSAVTTSYWCEGTRKVPKPFCTGPPLKVKQWFCIRFNSSNINDSRLVQYIFESGEEKFLLRKFHTGIFFSCEQAADMNGFDCRDFSEIAPEHERGLCGMVAHMMFTTIFQLAVAIGPEDWRPKTWDYSWSYVLAWGSFGTCMGSAVTALNRYTKTIIEFKYKRRNIEKSLMIKQKMMELDLPEQMWDMYLTTVPADAEVQLELPVNGHKPSAGTTYVVEMDNEPEPQGEAYC